MHTTSIGQTSCFFGQANHNRNEIDRIYKEDFRIKEITWNSSSSFRNHMNYMQTSISTLLLNLIPTFLNDINPA